MKYRIRVGQSPSGRPLYVGEFGDSIHPTYWNTREEAEAWLREWRAHPGAPETNIEEVVEKKDVP